MTPVYEEEWLDDAAVTRGAARGVGILVGRVFALQVVTAGVTIVVARLLSPRDYGIFAVAFAVQLTGQVLAQMGLGAALIRRRRPPTAAEQHAVAGWTLAVALTVAIAASAVAWVILPALGVSSDIARYCAVACIGGPFYAARVVPMTLLERNLRYGRVAVAEACETLAFNLFALVGALSGLGAYSLVGAIPASAFAGAVAVYILQPWAWGLSVSLTALRPLLRFGLQVVGLQITTAARDLAFVSMIAGLGSQSLAGFWALAQRLFAPAVVLAGAVQRVGFPALARTGDRALRRSRATTAVALSAVVVSLPLGVIAGVIEPLIDALLGDRWLPTADIVIIGAAGILILSSPLAVGKSLALADGDGATPLLSSLWMIPVQLGALVAASLIPEGGLSAAGVGLSLSLGILAGAVVLIPRTRLSTTACLAILGKATLAGGAAAVAGIVLGKHGLGFVPTAVGATAVWVALAGTLCRVELAGALRMSRLAIGRAPGSSA